MVEEQGFQRYLAHVILWIGIAPGPVAELARQGTAALAASF